LGIITLAIAISKEMGGREYSHDHPNFMQFHLAVIYNNKYENNRFV
jgi:hypothetical protein